MKEMESVKIRKLDKGEIPRLNKLMEKILPNIKYYPKRNLRIFMNEYSNKNLLQLFKRKDSLFLVAENKGNFIGFLFGWNDYGVFWIDWLGIEEKYRKQHIATQLLTFAEKEAKRMKCHKVFLDTSYKNYPAISFYKKMGYKIQTRLKKHWLKWDYYYLGKLIH